MHIWTRPRADTAYPATRTGPSSPDINPIEQVFTKLKAILRKAGARTVDDLWRAIGNGLDQFSPAEYSV